MTTRPRPAFALALAAAVAGAGATTPLPAGADEPELVERCYVEGLTIEQVEAGEESDVWCVEVTEDAALASRGSSVLVELFDATDYSGSPLLLVGTSCTGLAVNWGPTHPWNDRIGSTRLVACGSGKHYKDAGFTGDNVQKTGIGGHSFAGTSFDNAITSITYAP